MKTKKVYKNLRDLHNKHVSFGALNKIKQEVQS